MNPAFNTVISASAAERRGLFLAAAARSGMAVQNVEKDFWVCWTLDGRVDEHLTKMGFAWQ